VFYLYYSQVKDICNELDVRSLCHKILQNVSTLLRADRCSLFLVQGDRCVSPSSESVKRPKAVSIANNTDGGRENVDRIQPVGCLSLERPTLDTDAMTTTTVTSPMTAVGSTTVSLSISSPNTGSVVVGSPIGSTNTGSIDIPHSRETFSTSSTHLRTPSGGSHGCHSKCLVSKLFDVCSQSTLQEMENKKEIRIPWGTGIVGYVAESGESVNIPDAYKVSRK